MYKDFGKIFDIPVFNVGTSVEEPQFHIDCGELQDFLMFYMSSNVPGDNVDIDFKLVNEAGIETTWINWTMLPGTNGLIQNMMMGNFMGYGFKLRATNNSGNNITNFKLYLQSKSM
ncbi:MAG: hypothetical protein ACFFDH_00535 [Promethearchaeota archaeon]